MAVLGESLIYKHCAGLCGEEVGRSMCFTFCLHSHLSAVHEYIFILP